MRSLDVSETLRFGGGCSIWHLALQGAGSLFRGMKIPWAPSRSMERMKEGFASEDVGDAATAM